VEKEVEPLAAIGRFGLEKLSLENHLWPF
jgi:hypothetical protein